MNQKNKKDRSHPLKPYRSLRRQVVFLALVLLTTNQPSWAINNNKLATKCDRLAASSLETSKPSGISGVPFNQIDTAAAIPACKAASELFPQDIRLAYQYGRSLHAAKRYRDAMDQYHRAAKLGKNTSILALLATNTGVIHRYGYDGVVKNSKLALNLFKTAAKTGLSVAQWNAAGMYELGEGPTSKPNFELAATYWRKLAVGGDIVAVEKIGLAILDKKILPSPLYENEMVRGLKYAAHKGQYNAAYRYAEYLKNKDPDEGAKYALKAYRISLNSPKNNEYSWILYRRNSFSLYRDFLAQDAKNTMTGSEYKDAQRQFPKGKIQQFTVKVKCENHDSELKVFLWDWRLTTPPTDPQFKWMKSARNCFPRKDVEESFRNLYSISRKHNVSFGELAVVSMQGQSKINAYLSKNSKKYRDNRNAKALTGLARLLFGGSSSGNDSSGCSAGQTRDRVNGGYCPGKAPMAGVDY